MKRPNTNGALMWRVLSWLAPLAIRPAFFTDDPGNGGNGGGGGAGDPPGNGGNGGGGAGGEPKTGGDLTPEKLARIQEDAKRAFAERDRLSAQLRQMNEQLAELQREREERAAAERKAQEEAEQRKLEEEKEYKQALAAKEQKFQAEVEQVRERARANAMEWARDRLKGTVASIDGILPSAIDDVAGLLLSSIALDDNYQPYVKGPDGRPRKNAEDPTKPFTLQDLAKEFIASRPHYLKASTPPGTGNKPGEGEGPAGGGLWDIRRAEKDVQYNQEWKAKDPEGNKAAWAKLREEREKASWK